jgi:hypothetical protein
MLRPSCFLGKSVLSGLLLACASLPASELPATVAASIAQISPTASPGEITPFEDAGETLYNVAVQTPGSPDAREWYFDSKGVPVGVQSFEKELPPGLSKSLALRLKPKGTGVLDAVKIFAGGKPLYEVEIQGATRSRVLGFYPDGKPAYTERRMLDLPKTLQIFLPDIERAEGAVESAIHLESKGRDLYQLTIHRPRSPLRLTLNASGALVEREEVVGLQDTPKSVQSAIAARTSSGEPLRILLKRAGKTVEFEVYFFRDSKLHILQLSETGEPKGPPVEPLKLP